METSNMLSWMKGVFLYEARKRHEREDLRESYILKQFSFCNGKNTFSNYSSIRLCLYWGENVLLRHIVLYLSWTAFLTGLMTNYTFYSEVLYTLDRLPPSPGLEWSSWTKGDSHGPTSLFLTLVLNFLSYIILASSG